MTPGEPPETRYAKSGDVHIAYQIVGDGPVDLLLVQGAFTNVEYQWEEPSYASYLERLASFSRLILFDARGAGLSDKTKAFPTFEVQMDDVNAVLDAVGSEQAALFGLSQGGAMSILYAATYAARTSALLLYSTFPVVRPDGDFPWGRGEEWRREYERQLDQEWGQGTLLDKLAPTRAADPVFRSWWARFERFSAAPGDILAYYRMTLEIDVRPVLPTITVPTLILHRRDDEFRPVATSRYLAERIPGAKLVELEGRDHLPYASHPHGVIDEVQEFLTGVRPGIEADRVLATVLFTDIVGSTERAAAIGDRRWTELLQRHDHMVRRELGRHRGREVETAGDGFLATFDGPARGIRCARSICQETRALGLEVRAGLHTGEVEIAGAALRGIAVHIAARVAGLAGPGEVLVSSTVKDLVAGSGIEFEDRGSRALRGVPGEWRLFTVTSG
jgi:pimeloyl-ACP methyl ester carboxylesterase